MYAKVVGFRESAGFAEEAWFGVESRRPSRERWNNPSAPERVGLNSGPNGLLDSRIFGALSPISLSPFDARLAVSGGIYFRTFPPTGPRMAEEEIEDEAEDEPSEPDLEGDEFAPDDEEDLLVGDADDEVLVAVVGDGAEVEVEDTDDDEEDLEEELHPDDVEEPLDVLLLERTSSGRLDEDEYEDEDDADTDERAEPGSRIPPKRPGEFVCRSCFLVKHPSQLADAERVLCSDCV